ncbi:MAG TPA: nuclear transport factor 2 family protein [Streptosporangiaceae bacterium]|jgi:ketosteroid isomerase-like protein
MATQRETDEAAIRQRIHTLVEAIRAHDLEAAMPIYAPDLVSFDFEPPLRHMGPAAKRRNWTAVFAAYQAPLDYETRDLTITVGDDVAFGYALARISGTLRNGTKNEYWVRWTTGFRKIDGDWFITHDQVSVPTDVQTGRARLNLEP